MKLKGVVVALLTPELKNGVADAETGVKIANFAIDGGVDGLFVMGTNGEGFRFSTDERIRYARAILDGVNRQKAQVCIHTTASTLEDTLRLSRAAYEDGADSIAVMTPAMLPYDDNQLYEFYKTVADSVPDDFPVYLYNIPQRTANDISGNLYARLKRDCKNVAGIKYSFNDLNRTMEYIAVEGGEVLHGSDIYQLQYRTMGCVGVISGLSGVFPKPFCKVRDAIEADDLAAAQKWQRICFDAGQVLQFGNVSVMKEGFRLMGFEFGGSHCFNGGDAEKFRRDFEKIQKLISENE